MAAPRRHEDASVEGRLRREPHRFDFFQAVRVLEASYREKARTDRRWEREAVGHDAAPAREVVRFRAHASLSFPPGEIAALEQPRPEGVEDEWRLPPLEMTVSFLGLTGPTGALPDHYTATLIARMRKRDNSMRRFFDLFNHRATSLFYRAWAKYRFGCGYESAARGAGPDHLPTWYLFSLLGLGTDHLRARSRVPDEAFLYYGGIFARRGASAVSVERMLAEYFELPVEVHQFEGEWLHLRREDRTRLPSSEELRGRHNRLGVDTVLGQQAWDVRGKVRLRVGPMDYAQYSGFLPGGAAMSEITDLARQAFGPELAFGVQPVLRAAEIPECVLDSAAQDPLRLGANVWLRSVQCTEDFDGARFASQDQWGVDGG
jgi:type VI secretion system protein ImpH